MTLPRLMLSQYYSIARKELQKACITKHNILKGECGGDGDCD
jgi:hypothetical protein